MKRIIPLVVAFTFIFFIACAQNNTATGFVIEGIKLHDKGDYSGAIALYKKALGIDNKLSQANYELASSYFAIKEYNKVVAYCNKVIAARSNYIDQAYILKGSAQDLLGNPKIAVTTYKEAIKKYPANSLLYYNLALTAFNLKNYKETDDALENSLKLNPAHASSHLLLGHSMGKQGNGVKSILALSNFLLIEPTGTRAETALQFLESELKTGTSNGNENETAITVPQQKKSDGFSTAGIILSLFESSRTNEANKNKTSYQFFTEQMKSLFITLGELKKDNTSFWWTYYVDFFYALTHKGYVEAFSYYITQSKKDKNIDNWLQSNKEVYDAFANWYVSYKR